MRRILVLGLCIILVMTFIAGCSGGSKEANTSPTSDQGAINQAASNQANQNKNETTEAPKEVSKAAESSKTETIRGTEVDFGKNNLVVIKDYKGNYSSELQKMDFESTFGSHTYSVAIFGSIVNVNIMVGKYGSEGFDQRVASVLSDTMLTFKKAAGPGDDNDFCALNFSDSSGQHYSLTLSGQSDDTKATGIIIVKDSGINNVIDSGRILKETFAGEGYKFLVEQDKTNKIRDGLFINYLYLKYDNNDKMLIAKSVDKGNDWLNSIGNIVKVVMSNDGTKVYYETDNSFTRTNGAGSNNHRTRVYDLKTKEDQYFEEGGISLLINDGAYKNDLVLECFTNGANGVEPYYSVYTPQAEKVVQLSASEYPEYPEIDIEYAINKVRNDSSQQSTPEQSTPPVSQEATLSSVNLKIINIPPSGVDKSTLCGNDLERDSRL